jgi:hypothetical protein
LSCAGLPKQAESKVLNMAIGEGEMFKLTKATSRYHDFLFGSTS